MKKILYVLIGALICVCVWAIARYNYTQKRIKAKNAKKARKLECLLKLLADQTISDDRRESTTMSILVELPLFVEYFEAYGMSVSRKRGNVEVWGIGRVEQYIAELWAGSAT
ncbi:MAG: hypothetical protein ACEQSA_01000 [Weeksellaceae bacterium]